MSYEIAETIVIIVVILVFLWYAWKFVSSLFHKDIGGAIASVIVGAIAVVVVGQILFGILTLLYPKESEAETQRIEQMNSGYDDNYYEDDRDAFDPGW